MEIKTNKISTSFVKVLDVQANWTKNAILQMLDHEDFEEHPKIKLCNEYLNNVNLQSPKARKKRKNVCQ
ncbi:hypothetical protein SAMN04487995_6034 [Dyadobacter koreensis]|uniref:Uncharacterized protein n=1 Tax=Dyadobacter koreensis TaxID=408657 RepID=A0A1H7AZN3_9BACT|nr:hypothetical protein SAMN04487995_6034 [Dyadobacter koreensis]